MALAAMICVALIWAVQAEAQPVLLGPDSGVAWDASTASDIKDYEIWLAPTPGGHDFTKIAFTSIVHPIVSTTFNVTEPPEGVYYVVVTARDHAGNRSLPSNEIHIEYDSTAPDPVQIKAIFGG